MIIQSSKKKQKVKGTIEWSSNFAIGKNKLGVLMFYCISALLLVILPNRAIAEDALTLRRAIELAIEENNEIKAMRSSVFAEKENIGIARSYLLPKITLEERFLRTDNPTYGFMSKLNQERFAIEDFAINSLNNPRAINDFQTTISFEQPLFVSKAYIGLDMSKKEFMAKDEEYKRKKEEIAVKVASAYYMILTAMEYVKVTEKGIEDAQEHLRIAEARNKAGLGLHSDLLRAQTALTEAEQRNVKARKDLEVAERMLGLLIGKAGPVKISAMTDELQLRDIDYYLNSALSRKDLEALKRRYENAQMNLKMAKSAYLPVIGIGGSFQLNDHRGPLGSEGSSYQVMAFLRWEVFDGTKREHEIVKAQHQASAMKENMEGLKIAINFKVHEAYLNVEEARKNYALAASALKTAEEGRRLVRIRYEGGLSPIVDLLDAQMNVDHARANLLAMENNMRIALMNLSYEAGTILKDLNIGQ